MVKWYLLKVHLEKYVNGKMMHFYAFLLLNDAYKKVGKWMFALSFIQDTLAYYPFMYVQGAI